MFVHGKKIAATTRTRPVCAFPQYEEDTYDGHEIEDERKRDV
jgi:hypothetical protein